MPDGKHVALLIETTTSLGRGLICGVMNYARQHAPKWIVHFDLCGQHELHTLLGRWKGQGVIGQLASRQQAEFLAALELTAVNVSGCRHDDLADHLLYCSTDSRQAGHLCATHLLERGFRHFAFYRLAQSSAATDALQHSFRAAVRRAGFHCALYEVRATRTVGVWRSNLTETQAWLESLPKPVAILASDAARGRTLLEACRAGQLAVPQQVAVLAGQHDDLCCELSEPPLSSLDPAPRRVGFAAAQLLDRFFRGELKPPQSVAILPAGITTRRSTDTVAVEDPLVARAVRFIHDHASEPIQVKDVLREVLLSRRALEQRFRAALGRSPAGEIRRRKLDVAKRLLQETDLSLAAIAAQVGFQYHEVFTRTFRRETGMSPSHFRRQGRQPQRDV